MVRHTFSLTVLLFLTIITIVASGCSGGSGSVGLGVLEPFPTASVNPTVTPTTSPTTTPTPTPTDTPVPPVPTPTSTAIPKSGVMLDKINGESFNSPRAMCKVTCQPDVFESLFLVNAPPAGKNGRIVRIADDTSKNESEFDKTTPEEFTFNNQSLPRPVSLDVIQLNISSKDVNEFPLLLAVADAETGGVYYSVVKRDTKSTTRLWQSKNMKFVDLTREGDTSLQCTAPNSVNITRDGWIYWVDYTANGKVCRVEYDMETGKIIGKPEVLANEIPWPSDLEVSGNIIAVTSNVQDGNVYLIKADKNLSVRLPISVAQRSDYVIPLNPEDSSVRMTFPNSVIIYSTKSSFEESVTRRKILLATSGNILSGVNLTRRDAVSVSAGAIWLLDLTKFDDIKEIPDKSLKLIEGLGHKVTGIQQSSFSYPAKLEIVYDGSDIIKKPRLDFVYLTSTPEHDLKNGTLNYRILDLSKENTLDYMSSPKAKVTLVNEINQPFSFSHMWKFDFLKQAFLLHLRYNIGYNDPDNQSAIMHYVDSNNDEVPLKDEMTDPSGFFFN